MGTNDGNAPLPTYAPAANGAVYNPATNSWTQPTQAPTVPSTEAPKYQATASAPWNSASSGLDFSKQGAGEQWWDTTGKSGYANPTVGEQWWNQYGGQFNTPSYSEQTQTAANSQIGNSALATWYQSAGNPYAKQTAGEQYGANVQAKYGYGNTPNGSNYAEQYYKQFPGAPALSEDLAPYYTDAERRANEQINSQAASRGMFGSSYAADQGREATVNLEAQRAKDEAQYGLSRAGEMRNWEQLGGQLAGQADTSNLQNAQNKLAWTTGIGSLLNDTSKLGLSRAQGSQGLLSALDQSGIDRANAMMGIAGNADSARMSRLTAGQSGSVQTGSQGLSRLAGGAAGSGQAQTQQRQRGQDYLSGVGGLTDSLSSVLGSGYSGILSNDSSSLQGMLNTILGKNAEGLNQATQNKSSNSADTANTMQTVATLAPLLLALL
jgi:hypothetical protein